MVLSSNLSLKNYKREYEKLLNSFEKIKKEKERLWKIASGRSMSSKMVLFGSDFHVGSSTAIAPLVMWNSETENEIKANRIQEKFYNEFMKIRDSLSQKAKVFGLNGDLIDGRNKKQFGNQTTLPIMTDQCDAVISILKEVKTENIVVTRGSGYHVQLSNIAMEEYIARELGAHRYRAYNGETVIPTDGTPESKGRALTDFFALFKVGGKLFNMSHHVGYSKLELYRTTALARELMGLKLAVEKYHKAHVVARGHVHYHVRVGFTHTEGFTLPAWKLPDGHLFRQGMSGTSPDIGMVEVIVEPNGELFIRSHIAEIDIKPTVIDFDR